VVDAAVAARAGDIVIESITMSGMSPAFCQDVPGL
jgi:hypothetical protein